MDGGLDPVADESPGEPAGREDAPFEGPGFGAEYLNNPPPDYPRISLRRGEEGTVLLRVRVSAQGEPLDWSVEESSGYRRLDDAAQAAIAYWEFEPARRGGRAVEGVVLVPMEFSIR